MATTEEVLSAARAVGDLIAKHEAGQKFEKAVKLFQKDIDAQRLMNDYQRHLMTIAHKEQSGQPVEVADKHRLEKLQTDLSRNLVLQQLQMAQMDYLDLMRQVDEAISGEAAPAEAPEASLATPPGAAGPVLAD